MPSREEIAGWLEKEGDSTVRIWADLIGTERANEKAAIWYDRATRVENMRCENCTVGKDLAMIPSTSNPNPVKREKPDIFCPMSFTLFPAGHYCGEFKQKDSANANE